MVPQGGLCVPRGSSILSEGEGPQLAGEALGGVWLPSIQGILSASLLPSFVFLPLPSPLRNSLPSPSIALSSLLLHGRPKVLVLDLRWSGFTDPLPANPIPNALALGKGSRFRSSLLASTQHDLGDKVDNGRRRLVGVKLCEEVASVVCGAALLPGHEAKELSRGASLCLHPLSFLWVQVTEGDSVEGVVSSKEELSLIVSQCDALGRDLEVNNGGSWCGVSSQSLRCGFGNGLRPGE